jgi:hypothetical protein
MERFQVRASTGQNISGAAAYVEIGDRLAEAVPGQDDPNPGFPR